MIPGPVQIDGQEVDPREPVLLAVGLDLDEEHLLREPVRCVRLLRIAGPEVVLAKRHGRELRVRADRPEADELPDAGPPRLFDELDPHDRVLEKEESRVLAVCADASDDRGKMNDEVRFLLREIRAHGFALAQIEASGARRQEGAGAARFERVNERAPEKAARSGDENAAARPEAHALKCKSGSAPKV